MAAIQVKNVPQELHDKLRERAGGENMTLSAYILRVLEEDVAEPRTLEEWFEQREFKGSVGNFDLQAFLDEARAEREREVDRKLGHRLGRGDTDPGEQA